jgi:hypothetical protein
MAAKPSATDPLNWGTKYNDFLDVAHNADGTLKTSVIAATFTPASYSSEESVTFPNGFTMKIGYVAKGSNPQTITFAVPFTTIISASITNYVNSAADYESPTIKVFNTTTLVIHSDQPVTGFLWQAWGK